MGSFQNVIGQEDAKLALIMNAIDPRCGGLLIVGEKGSGKSTLARHFRTVLAPAPFVEVPLNVTEDAVSCTIDVEQSIREGKQVHGDGLIARARGGVLYIDDVNLLPAEILSLLMEEKQRDYILLATMNLEEGILSPHWLDRFGMCVICESVKSMSQRVEIMKMVLKNGMDGGDSNLKLRERLRGARHRLGDIVVSSSMHSYITQRCLERNVLGHRGDIFLYYASRAYAAYCDEGEVTEAHVDRMIPLVLGHRERMYRHQHDDHCCSSHDHKEHEHTSEENHKDRNKDSSHPGDVCNNDSERTEHGGETLTVFSRDKDEVFAPGNLFKVKSFHFRKDRIPRRTSGKRTKTGVKGRSGRYVRSTLHDNGDIALDATIRSAAPYQVIRGRTDSLIIHDSDMRFKQRERKMGHLVVFVVDGSGSMGARRRMVETKGAVLSLLTDCYQKRDRVSMIVFRKAGAEIVLPPTGSVEMASKQLRELPVGGKTPLSAGLLETYKLINWVSMKTPHTRILVVLVTDGRANQSVSEMPVGEEIERTSLLLRTLPHTDFIVIDTEEKRGFMRTDQAKQIASWLNSEYYTIDDLKADSITEIIKRKKGESASVNSGTMWTRTLLSEIR